jgi:SAM-dependent methyltransferase
VLYTGTYGEAARRPRPLGCVAVAGPQVTDKSDFNTYKDTYRQAVEESIAFSGRGVDYFAEHKALHLAAVAWRHLGDPASLSALDLGCGIGATDAFAVRHFGELHGADIATEAIARAEEANPAVTYTPYDGVRLPYHDGSFDLAFTINVLHHVPVEQRSRFATEMSRVVRPGGLAVVIEHNQLNPLTSYAVSRCEFDEDAVLLTRRAASLLLQDAGLRPTERRYILFAPLAAARAVMLDRWLRWLPLGGQYYVAAKR